MLDIGRMEMIEHQRLETQSGEGNDVQRSMYGVLTLSMSVLVLIPVYIGIGNDRIPL